MTDIGGLGAAAEDLDDLADALEAAADEVDEAVDAGVQKTAFQMEGTAKRHAPVDTGALRASIQARRLNVGRWAVGSSMEYAADVEYGTAPHPITPDDADALRFPGPDGDPVFAQHVDHPGTPAQPYLRPSLKQHESGLVDNIAAEIEALLEAHL
ncbi:phage protein, HK97 gp10 family [Halorientalis persicus]|uniref:Phage protein, HK97 gp10 family n=1 Tax=Halorientalis persicus TaxID=1367881 RepID=A0A1H8RZP7_9EURY|nr:HK97-gp10 family putative phage morphogenesis protein [Halorientalis persicus]SEO71423.1 phage protein, HK97 gp10 family [Halorientalis persicus]